MDYSTCVAVYHCVNGVLASILGEGNFSQNDVEVLARLVAEKMPEKPLNYARTVARNWAVGRQRKIWYAPQMARLEHERLAKLEALKEECAEFETGRSEYWATAERALAAAKGTKTARAREYVSALYARVFGAAEGMPPDRLFPNVSPDARYQWVRRGKLMIKPYASPLLWRVITRHSRTA